MSAWTSGVKLDQASDGRAAILPELLATREPVFPDAPSLPEAPPSPGSASRVSAFPATPIHDSMNSRTPATCAQVLP
jgi:hypothetical protein